MIAAITTTAVFSVVLSSFVSDARADKRDAAAMVIRHAQEMLKNYVSAEPTSAAYVPSDGGTGRWSKDAYAGWALHGTVAGYEHNIDSLLTGTVLTGGTFRYRVFNTSCGFGTSDAQSCKRVQFFLNYTD
jgi:hypothetical protein